jgi:hypothetical protein
VSLEHVMHQASNPLLFCAILVHQAPNSCFCFSSFGASGVEFVNFAVLGASGVEFMLLLYYGGFRQRAPW